MKMERIAVLMSTYNGEKYLRDQIDSIINQKNVDVILMIRDDGSTDSTRSILTEYANRYINIHIFLESNVGFAQSFTNLLSMAYLNMLDVNYYSFADQDDFWLPNKLINAITLLKDGSMQIPLVYASNTQKVDASLKNIGFAWNPRKVYISKPKALIQSYATGCTMVFNRKAVEMYVKYHPKEIKVHDFLMYQIGVFLGDFIWDKNSYILYRQHHNNQIGLPDFWGRMEKRFKTKNYKAHTLQNQAKAFLDSYRMFLKTDDINIIEKFSNYSQSMTTKFRLLHDKRFRYDSLENNITFTIKVLLGGL